MHNKVIPRTTSIKKLTKLALAGADGKDWYRFANSQLEESAKLLNTTPKRLADLLGLFSPRVTVKRSIRFTIHYIRNNTYAHDVMIKIKAAVEHYERTGEIRGPKTSAFSLALLGSYHAIVLDTWMGIAFNIDPSLFRLNYVRKPCEEKIWKVAQYLGWSPCETQAAIWTEVVRQNNRNVPQMFLLSELAKAGLSSDLPI